MVNMDNVEQLHVVLQQSFSPDANLRGPAEENIRNLKNIPGSTTLLLKIAAEKQVRYYRGLWHGSRPSSMKVFNSALYRGF